VTGCSRSGTKYTTFLLREFGYEVGHERYARDGIVAWQLAAQTQPGDRPPWGCPPRRPGEHRLFHLVRDPFKAIPSLAYRDWHRRSRTWRNMFLDFEDLVGLDTNLLTRATLVYCRWNALVPPQNPELTMRVEDAPALLEQHFGWAPRSLPAPCNQRPHKVHTPADILNQINGIARRELQAFCEQYGYGWPG